MTSSYICGKTKP